jgi:nicotinate-nucleotide adenylyltransferase
MRIGILGGTFDPIHKGHIRLAQGARRKLGLDKVIFIPANIPPHKKNIDVLPARERYKMVRLAIKGKPYFGISDCEIIKGGVSYSVSTLRAFRKKFGKKAKLFFLAGSDSLSQLKTWKDFDKITQLAEFAVAARPGHNTKKISGVRIIRIPTIDISSTDIRDRIRGGLNAKKFLTSGVYGYINKKGFYRCT